MSIRSACSCGALLVASACGRSATLHAVNIHAPPPTSIAPVSAAERPGASRIVFWGNERVSRAQLLRVMHFPSEGPYPKDVLENDVLWLTSTYYDLGYLAVHIDAPVVQGDEVRIHIEEGPRFHVGKFEVRDVDARGAPITTPDGIPTRNHFHVRTGDWIDRSLFVRDMATVRQLYQDIGYAVVDVTLETAMDRAHAIIDITIPKIDVGPYVTIDHVDIIGAPSDLVDRVRRTIGIGDGAAFSETKLERARHDLLALGLFKRVDVSYTGIDDKAATSRATIHFELTLPAP